MSRKSHLLAAAMAILLPAALSAGIKEAQLAKLKTELKLSPEQVEAASRLLDELTVLRRRVVAAKKPADVETAKGAFRKKQESGFSAILTPEQFAQWKKIYLVTPPPDAATHTHHH